MEALPMHIGLHKTGSTFLQRAVFPCMFPDVPTGKAGTVLTVGATGKLLIEEVRGDSEASLADNELQPNLQTHFVSAESLTGRQKANYPGENWERFERFCHALTLIRETPRLLLVVREHNSWLRSAYLHQYRLGARATFERHVASFSDDDLSWSKRIERLSSYPLLVILHEDLLLNRDATIQQIADFWGVEWSNECSQQADKFASFNVNPRTRIALVALHYYSIFVNLIARLFPARLARTWRRTANSIRVQDSMVRVLDRLSSRPVDPDRYRLPDDVARRLARDWEASVRHASRPD